MADAFDRFKKALADRPPRAGCWSLYLGPVILIVAGYWMLTELSGVEGLLVLIGALLLYLAWFFLTTWADRKRKKEIADRRDGQRGH